MSRLHLLVGLLPFIVCLWTWRVCAQGTGEWRRSLAVAAVVVGLVVGIGTEALSVLHAIEPFGLLLLYAVHVGALTLVSSRLRRSGRRTPPLPLRRLANVWAAAAVAIAGILLLLSLVAPPNNWDSMTYHMPRVVHWAWQGDVSYYATHIDRQLFLQPWAEYAILHTYVLSGSDVYANLVQWVAMVVSVVMVTLVAKNLGLSPRGQVASGIIALTIPMGITQAATTQNDYVAAMWITVVAAVVTDLAWSRSLPLEAAMVGSAAGLAAMTKATSYFFLAPLLLWWLFQKVELRAASLGRAALVVAVPVLVLTAPGFLRNIDTFSRPLGPSLSEFVNDPVGPRAMAENAVRHGALQFATPSQSVNDRTTDLTRTLSSAVGLDLDRAGSTFPEGYQFRVTFGRREDDAQAFAASALFVVSLPWLLIARRRLRGVRLGQLGLLVGCGLVGALLLEAYFRWNPWNGRYLLPLFLLSAVASAVVAQRLPRVLYRVLLAALLASSLLWVLASDLRPLTPPHSVLSAHRQDLYFAARPELRLPYIEATDYVRSRGDTTVGYVGALDDWEYPLWVLLNDGDRAIALESVNVQNPSRRYERGVPSTVICTTQCPPPEPGGSWAMRRFGPVSVWERL